MRVPFLFIYFTLFEGNVLHAGAEYKRASNTRVHLYLDVEAFLRDPNGSWGPPNNYGWSQ